MRRRLPPHLGRAGEGDLVDAGMAAQRAAERAGAGEDVHDTGRQAAPRRRSRRRRSAESGVRLRRLQHHRVAGGERRRDLPRQHQQRKIPRDDLAAHADGAPAGELRRRQRRPAGMVIEVPRHQRNVDVAALADRLAVVHRLQHGEEPLAFLHVPRQRIEMPRPRLARQRRPGGKRRPRRRHRRVGVGLAAECDAAEQRAVGRVVHLELPAVARGDEAAADEVAEARPRAGAARRAT